MTATTPKAATGLHRPLCPDGRAAREGGGSALCAERARPLVLAATILASAMAFIDGSVVNIALPAMQADLGRASRRCSGLSTPTL